MASRVLSRSLLARSSPLLRSRITPLLRPTLPRAHLLRNPSTARFTSAPTPPAPSLSQRLKALSKEYGYSALGVYLALSALDFPFCFLAVRYLGAERVGRWEDVVIGFVKPYLKVLGFKVGEKDRETGTETGAESGLGGDAWILVEEKNASLWTELALAYVVHKSFIFLRVPLTVAVTPKVVRVLRGWGWDIGRKGMPKINITPKKSSTPPGV